jgi:iron complex transport system substrate-binding protein
LSLFAPTAWMGDDCAMKIVSLLPSATEIVFALGLADELSGITTDCDYPPEIRTKRVVSSTQVADVALAPGEIDALVTEMVDAGESIYALDESAVREMQPDLILAQDLCRVCAVPSGRVTEALDKIGCSAEVISLDPHDLEGILDGILRVGRAAGKEQVARELVDSLRDRIEAVRTVAGDLRPVPTLALEWPDPFFVGGHWVPEMVAVAGGHDVLGRPGVPSRRVSPEHIERAAPEVLVYMPCGFGLADALSQVDDLLVNPAIAVCPAVEGNQVFAVDGSSYFSRPGPRIVDGLEALAWVLHPDFFEEPPPGRVEKVPVESRA